MPQSSKYFNALQAGFSYVAGTTLNRPFISSMPPAIGVELTNHCNLKCPECPSGAGAMKRERGFMDPGLFSNLIREIGPFLLNANLYFQGEPMMHPAFFDFLEIAGDAPCTVSTNGHFLTPENCRKLGESRLRKLIISLDGLDQNTYSAYRRNGNIEKVKEGIIGVAEAVRRSGSPMKVEVQVLVNKHNESQIAGIKRFITGAGASPVLKSMQIYNSSSIAEWMPSDDRFRRYRLKDGSYAVRNKLPRRCARLWFNPVVTWDGRVIPCCFDKDAEFVMGDLSYFSFREIWHGRRFREFRRMILTGREKIPICINCTSGLSGVKT